MSDSKKKLHPVVVTGGSRGIGAATVERLALLGHPVVFSYASRSDAADALVARLQDQGAQALAVKGDAANPDAVTELFVVCRKHFGRCGGVFANAGITGPATRLEGLEPADLRRVIDVNVIGTFSTAQAAIREMSTAHGGTGGAIVLMSSRAAQLGGGGEWLHYAASKGAIDTLTIGLARELGQDGIRVNAVAPGLIDTEIHAAAGLGDRLVKKAGDIPVGRVGSAGEVADTVVWLLSDAAAYVSGTIVYVSGGR
jgi:NAD(P)-dependent dehydrogenase (short-subunit alcohol dehydrogenase family)